MTITMSEKSFALHAFTSYPSSSPPAPTSSSLDAPRLTRCEFGIISLISLMNIFRRELGSREVVTQTLGSSIPAVAYSSSACVYTVTRLPGRQTFSSFVLSSSISTTCFSFSASYRSSVGTFFPARHHPILVARSHASASRIFCFFSYSSFCFPSNDLRYKYSFLKRMSLRSILITNEREPQKR